MRAAVSREYGPPSVVRVEQVPDPVPGPGDLLVRVHASGVNRTDSAYRAGRPWFARAITGVRRPRATVLGCEYAGVVADVGATVTGFDVGARVYGFSETRFGGHAELVVVPADGPVATVPDEVSLEQAAASTEGVHYAVSALRRAAVQPGQEVLVYGATGAIGSALVQVLAGMGVRQTAVCPERHVELVRGLGADRVVALEREDFTKDAQHYDVVIDAVGRSTFSTCKRLLKPHGSYLSSELGPWGSNPALALVTPVLPGRSVRFPLPLRYDKAHLLELRDLLARGVFRPVIDRTVPLDQVVAAHAYVETGRKVGNVVLTVP